MPTTFDTFFRTATGNVPYAYQRRLAGDTAGRPCQSQLIHIPTGLGKTAAVVLAWLWNRVAHPDVAHRDTWPRRLVYCLPMRTLVEQTRDEIIKWVKKLLKAAEDKDIILTPAALERLRWLAEHSPVVLIGGEELDAARRDWDLYPEKPALLIGTQDMLLSRALNRGYGMSRYRWPMHFALLNNDCLWVMDETQLMGPGLSTACQLEAFRSPPDHGFSSFGKSGSVTWYMSATSNPESLKTRDWRDRTRPDGFAFGLTEQERNATSGEVHKRRTAKKRLELDQDSHFGDASVLKALVEKVLGQHNNMLDLIAADSSLPARTLIICNAVDRAVAVHAQLAASNPKERDLVLLHSRFRPPERREQMERLKNFDRARFPQGQIVVATQVIEAGVDISSAILCSEIAPLASLVQRLGRLNRAGEFLQSSWEPLAMIVGLGLEPEPQKEKREDEETRLTRNAKRCLPYELDACKDAVTELERLQGDASPANLENLRDAIAASISRCPYSLQRHELLDFFDTDANLSLGFTDVSPFVRGLDEDTDFQVLWRDSWPQVDGQEGTGRPGFTPDFQRDELCSVPISKAKDARDILKQGWVWRGKDSGWISVRDAGLSPGMTILLPTSAGGYDADQGWTGNRNDKSVSPHFRPEVEPADEDLLSCLENGWQSIAEHTQDVQKELSAILADLSDIGIRQDASWDQAVAWHDVGKNLPGWQNAVSHALEQAGIVGKQAHRPFAKFSLSESPQLRNPDGSRRFTGSDLKREIQRLRRFFRPGLAHEVASALAFRQAEQKRLALKRDNDLTSLLAEYLIMSHHGHVRKVLRDELPRFPSDPKDTETVRGIASGTPLPTVTINGQSLGCDALSTDCRKMGRGPEGHESYTRAVLRLLEHYGPFRLAYFEAVFRAADMRASRTAATPAASTTIPPGLPMHEREAHPPQKRRS